MASASRPTAKMSSADALFATRSSGSMRASAAFAGSSEGNGLSVAAIKGRGMGGSRAWALSPSQYFRIDAIRRCLAAEKREDVVDDDIRHLLTHLHHRAAEMRRGDDVGHFQERRRHLGFVLEYVEASAGDLALPERSRQRLLVDDRPARGIDQEGGRLHQREFTGTDLVPRRRQQRRMQRHEIGIPEQLIERNIGHAEILLEGLGLAARRPIEDAHTKAAGATGHAGADASAAADQPDGLAVD